MECSFERSPCPIAVTLDILGDRWTLVVIRDLFMGKTRYAQFLESPEEISTNILAARLKRLESAGLVEKRAYQQNPTRYEYQMTERGADTLPILHAVVQWARKHFPDTWTPPERFFEATPETWLAQRDARLRELSDTSPQS